MTRPFTWYHNFLPWPWSLTFFSKLCYLVMVAARRVSLTSDNSYCQWSQWCKLVHCINMLVFDTNWLSKREDWGSWFSCDKSLYLSVCQNLFTVFLIHAPSNFNTVGIYCQYSLLEIKFEVGSNQPFLLHQQSKAPIGIALSVVHLSDCPSISHALLLLAPRAFRRTLVTRVISHNFASAGISE